MKKTHIIIAYFALIISLGFTNCSKSEHAQKAFERAHNLLPSPEKLVLFKEVFILNKQTRIAQHPKAVRAIDALQHRLETSSGYQLPITEKHSNNNIIFKDLDNTNSLGNDGYKLIITSKGIEIGANHGNGFFYAVQTLLQLMDDRIWHDHGSEKRKWAIATLEIQDRPKHQWRSLMFDSGREYQSVEFIKSYLDRLAMLKMNVFHWHLTEGRGWRIEIKKYPKLTDIGAFVAEGPSKGKFYTQEEIREVVAYAAKKNIEVVPEIDIPGHSEAALSAYPEYTCFGQAPESVMAFTSTLFCAGQEKTYQFLEDVFDEVCALFPSQYIHIGGDEAPKANWDKCVHCQNSIKQKGLKNSHELQIDFTNRIAAYLKSKGRKAICWGDVIHQEGPELEDNVVVYWWNWRGHKDKALKAAVKKNVPVICGTNYYTYLNFPVTPWTSYKANRTFDLKTAYEQNPSNLTEDKIMEYGNVLGMGTCLWTDWYVYQDMIDKRVFPRIYALAEQMWHKGTAVPFDEFHQKVKAQYPKLKILNVDYGPAMKEDIGPDFTWDQPEITKN
ncbi:beta-N-acetylhexosaminidase [Fulvivirgaceae bacterium BMA10]|uniref:beta-N-acetylhexosaminidase n=1 Tax=Splendidivirga corallicola TaxID=3051826 RepID=A0ABT8KXV0_9BACT|nr:beta-N-acetylhexosaminidase [Fulvivirgaceae bacterium BMA10]